MFNFTGGEFLILLVVALIVLGPDKLPEAARKVGAFMREARQMSQGFRQEFMDAIDEPAQGVKSTFLEPMQDLRRSMQGPLEDLKQSMRPTASPPPAETASSAPDASAPDADGPSRASDAVPVTPVDGSTSPAAPTDAPTAPPAARPTPGRPGPARPTPDQPAAARPAPARPAPPPSTGIHDDEGLIDFLDLPVAGDEQGRG